LRRTHQAAAKIPRIGFLGNSTAELEANLVRPFRDGLRALGYEEGPQHCHRISLGRRVNTINFQNWRPI
jgi:hypothetical protein